MLPLILGVAAFVGFAKAAEASSREAELQEFERKFRPLPGGRHIVVEDRRVPGSPLVRRYRPALDPIPWEMHVGTDDEGMEHFALTHHPGVKALDVEIRPVRKTKKRPLNVAHVFNDEGSSRVASDPFYTNRLRYFHPEEGAVGWFIIYVETVAGKSWIFEHQSLHAETIRTRPMLPKPSARAAATASEGDADYAACLAALLARSTAQTAEAQRRADQVARELGRLKEDLPGMIDAARRYAAGPEGVAKRMAAIKEISAVVQHALYEIESATDIDADMKDVMRDIVALEGGKNLEQLRRAVEAELDAVKRSKS